MSNLILKADSYKYSHPWQYPIGTSNIYSYLESRGGKYEKTLFFGLQYYLREYLSKPINLDDINEAELLITKHGLPFNRTGWLHILNEHKGYLPIRITAVPEGTLVPTHNVLLTIEATDPKVPWITNWVETLIMKIWYPITVSTQSYYIKRDILSWLTKTSDDPKTEILFKLHDFGYRGVSSEESALIGGMSHIVNFLGSDTIAALIGAMKYYDCKEVPAFSIPAAEHSTITAWGKEHEVDAFRNMLTQFAKPGSLVAIVSDSYDLWNAVTHLWGEKLRDAVIQSGATVIIRPDSGNPPDVVLQVLKLLDQKFGSKTNSKGYKVLNYVRVIQGDGINQDSINDILYNATSHGYSASNIAFGMGGALLQQLNRDTQKFALKCSEVTIDGQAIAVSKNPVTDPGKKSKAGRLALTEVRPGELITIPEKMLSDHHKNILQPVFENGIILRTQTFSEVRDLANQDLK